MALTRGPRQVNADGTVTIYCKECEKPVARMMYRGFTTVDQCEQCKTGKVSPMQPEMEGINQYNDMNVRDPLGGEQPGGLARFMFKAIGFARKVLAPQPSEVVAKRKKFKPILSEPDDEGKIDE